MESVDKITLLILLEQFKKTMNFEVDQICDLLRKMNGSGSTPAPSASPGVSTLSPPPETVQPVSMPPMGQANGIKSDWNACHASGAVMPDVVINPYENIPLPRLEVSKASGIHNSTPEKDSNGHNPMKNDLNVSNVLPPSPVQAPQQNPASNMLPMIKQQDALRYADVPTNGQFVPVELSHIYSSQSFFVNLNYNEALQLCIQLGERYQVCKIPLNSQAIQKGMLCCLYNESDNGFYRGQIIKENSENKYSVLLVDFGEIVNAESRVMYQLEPEFARLPVMAINCFLTDYRDNDLILMENFLQHFFQLEQQVEICAKFGAPSIDNKYPVSLQIRSPGKDWKDAVQFVSENYPNLKMNGATQAPLLAPTASKLPEIVQPAPMFPSIGQANVIYYQSPLKSCHA